jgi:hypothetical protein
VEIRIIGSARAAPKIILRVENKEYHPYSMAAYKNDVVIDPINYELNVGIRKVLNIAEGIAMSGSFIAK